MEELDIKNLPIVGDSSDDDNEEIDSPLIIPQYDLPQQKQGVIDTSTGQIKEMKELTPWDYIKGMATSMNIDIKNPKSGCKKCFGRGWTSKVVGTGQPVPCSCIFPVQTPEKKALENDTPMAIKSRLATMSRTDRRKMQKNLFSGVKKRAKASLMKDAQHMEDVLDSKMDQ